MNYTPITEENVEKAATLYMNHYNQHSGGCWTYEKAYKRIHQMVTMEDSLCLMQEDDNDIPTGLIIGFLESYDDFTFYFLDEILIFGEYQNKGYGRLLLQEVEQRVRERGAQMIELVCPDDAHHMHLWGDRIFEKCGIRRDEEGDGGKTLEIRGKRRLSARDGGANYQQS